MSNCIHQRNVPRPLCLSPRAVCSTPGALEPEPQKLQVDAMAAHKCSRSLCVPSASLVPTIHIRACPSTLARARARPHVCAGADGAYLGRGPVAPSLAPWHAPSPSPALPHYLLPSGKPLFVRLALVGHTRASHLAVCVGSSHVVVSAVADVSATPPHAGSARGGCVRLFLGSDAASCHTHTLSLPQHFWRPQQV